MCAQYMLMGMDYDEFWNSSIDRWKTYERCYLLKTEKENENSWWLGAYIFEGVCVALSNAFGKGQSAKYPEKPHRITPLTDREKEEEQRKSKEQLRQYFEDLSGSINERAEKRRQEQTRVSKNDN